MTNEKVAVSNTKGAFSGVFCLLQSFSVAIAMTNEKCTHISFSIIIFRVAAVERFIKVIVHQPACVKLRGVLSGKSGGTNTRQAEQFRHGIRAVSSGFHRLCHG